MNDGLLAHSMAIAEGVAYDTALSWISDQVNRMKNDLSSGKQVEIDGLGYFYKDQAGNLQFQHESNHNFLIESFGLSSFQALPIDRKEALKVVHSKAASGEDEIDVTTRPLIHKMAKYSAAAALLSIVTLTAYKMDAFRNVNFSEISMNPFKKEKNIYIPTDYDSQTFDDSEIKSNSNLESEEEVVYLDMEGLDSKLKVRLKDPIPEKEKVEVYGRYHVVGGCFWSRKKCC